MSENTQTAYEMLWQEIQGGNHSTILAICSNSNYNLVQSPLTNDPDVIKTKLIALVQLSRFQEALDLVQTLQGLDFERAYIFYKLGNFEECLRICEGKSDKSFRQLKAQAVISM